MTNKLRVIVMGSSDFAVPALEKLAENDAYDVLLAVMQPDRPNARGKNKVIPLPMKQKAQELGIEVYQPENISREGEEKLRALRPDLMVVAAYGQILKKNILDIPAYGTLNIHGSLLPHLRGAAPVHHAIIGGDDVSGVTIMRLDEGMDTGDMLSHAQVPITPTTTAGELHDQLAELGSDLLIETIPGYISGEIRPQAQDHGAADYADKVDKHTGEVDWERSSRQVLRQINGTDPFPGAFSTLSNGKKIKLFEPEIVQMPVQSKPGTILKKDRKEGLLVQTADGAIRIGSLQMPGKKRMETGVFFVGNQLPEGCFFLPPQSRQE